MGERATAQVDYLTDLSLRYIFTALMRAGGVEYVILGALSWGPRSGYEIKQLVDKSTRFFWAASYGQIYPELRRLEAAGLVEGADDPQGGRRRKRYTLTAAGRARLREWLRDESAGYELRDEGLLKLFFASALEPGEQLDVVRGLRTDREAVLAQLREIERRDVARATPALVLDYGLRQHEWMVEWCREAEERLGGEEKEVAS
jgi:PadR family transcriptional regulator AphA